MIKIIKNWIMAIAIVMSAGGVLLTTAIPLPVFAADGCNAGFLGFPAWYRGLTDGECNITSPTSGDALGAFIWHIALNVIEIGLMMVGYIALFFILYGGFQLLIGRGSSDSITKARTMIANAVIGLVISIASVAVIRFVIGIMG